MQSAFHYIHHHYIFPRRVRVLSEMASSLLPNSGRVLDVGCGDGTISTMVMERKPQLTIEGVDVLERDPKSKIPMRLYDGFNIPFPDNTFDAVLLVDVVHHASDPAQLLKECARVTSGPVVIKDHFCDGLFADARLRYMDNAGNKRFGVALRYEYWPEVTWHDMLSRLGLKMTKVEKRVPLYPFPLSVLFGAKLHFVAAIEKAS